MMSPAELKLAVRDRPPQLSQHRGLLPREGEEE
jgi:hypothetical protein